MEKLYGVLLTLFISLLATFISSFLPLGTIAVAIIIGAIFSNSIKIPKKFNVGVNFSEKFLLYFAIALLGINLDFSVLAQLGIDTIFLIIISLVATLVFTFYLISKLKIEKSFGLILGVGSAICGSAAIAATKDILKVNKEKTAIAIAIINLLGTLGLFILPFIGMILGLSDVEQGILLGNTLQSVGHAIAAGFSVNDTVGQSATIVKMGRVLLLTPIIIWLIYYTSKQNSDNKLEKAKIKIPLFIIGFIFFSILASTQLLPQSIVQSISFIAEFSLLMAMSAIGLKISFKAIKESGWQAFVFAGYIFKFQILFSIILIAIFLK